MKLKLFCLVIIFFIMVSCGEICSNSIIKKIDSPNKKYTAIAFIRNCGATTDFSPQITLLKKGHNFNNTAGNVFIGNHSKFIDIFWKDESTLIIVYDCFKKNIFKQEKNKYGINIVYNKRRKPEM